MDEIECGGQKVRGKVSPSNLGHDRENWRKHSRDFRIRMCGDMRQEKRRSWQLGSSSSISL